MSAVVKEKHVETIFDYDLSQVELDTIACGLSESSYLELLNEETFNKDLMFLFAMRGESDKADFYMAKLNKEWVKLNLKWDSFDPTKH